MKETETKLLNKIKLTIQNIILEAIDCNPTHKQTSVKIIMKSLELGLKGRGYNISGVDTKSGYWKQDGDVYHLTENIELITVNNFNFQISFNQTKKIIDIDSDLYQHTTLNYILGEIDTNPIVEYTKEVNGYLFSFLSNDRVNLSKNDGFNETFEDFFCAINYLINKK